MSLQSLTEAKPTAHQDPDTWLTRHHLSETKAGVLSLMNWLEHGTPLRPSSDPATAQLAQELSAKLAQLQPLLLEPRTSLL